MKILLNSLLLSVGAMLVSACSKPAAEHEVMPVQDTVIAPQVQALDKAKAVQDTVNTQAAQADAALQSAEK